MNKTDGWHIGFWPGGMNSCVVLTHDVEGPIGMRQMEQMADLEERYNFRSSWNLPLAQYEIDWNLVGRLRQRGFEFGAHGLSHDGRLFRSQSDFSELAPMLQRAGARSRAERLPRAVDASPRRMDRRGSRSTLTAASRIRIRTSLSRAEPAACFLSFSRTWSSCPTPCRRITR